MQIKKINNDKLKIILNSNDLDEKNIDIDSFLSNPIDSQNFFFEILDLAEEKYDFDIENNKAIIETISLDNNNIFILTITKLKNDICTYNNDKSKIYYFENIDDLLNLYTLMKKNKKTFSKSSLYQFNNSYYLVLNEDDSFLENYLLEFSSIQPYCHFLHDIFSEYCNSIKY